MAKALKTLTVSELRTALAELPDDAPVDRGAGVGRGPGQGILDDLTERWF